MANKLSVTIIVHNPDLLDSYQVSDHPHVDVHDHLHLVRAGPDVTLYVIRTTSNSSASSTKGTANIHSQVICKFLDLVDNSKCLFNPMLSYMTPLTIVRARPGVVLKCHPAPLALQREQHQKGQPTFTINLQVFLDLIDSSK